jgi:hypothetical protein
VSELSRQRAKYRQKMIRPSKKQFLIKKHEFRSLGVLELRS